MQFTGGGYKHSLSYRFMTVVKDAILEHPNQEVRTLQDVERILRIRCILGSPAQVGESDADKVGFVDWQLVLYSCDLEGALGFIRFILDYKVRKNVLAAMPELAVLAAHTGRSPLPFLPPPWRKVDGGALAAVPKPFSALPPRGRRHVLAQLERLEEPSSQGNAVEEEDKAEEQSKKRRGDATHTVTFYGYLYPFKDRFEESGIPGSLTRMNPASEQKEYVRFLDLKTDDASKQKVREVLEDVLKGQPLYLINMAGAEDPMAAWLQQQQTVLHVETAE